MPRKLVPIEVETWTKKFRLEQYKEDHVSILVITPRPDGYLLMSINKSNGKHMHKPDLWTESKEQVEQRRKGLRKDGFELTTKIKRVPEYDAPPPAERYRVEQLLEAQRRPRAKRSV